jgi:hypothetical protein
MEVTRQQKKMPNTKLYPEILAGPESIKQSHQRCFLVNTQNGYVVQMGRF